MVESSPWRGCCPAFATAPLARYTADRVTSSPTASTLVVVATYNEIENLPRLVEEIFRYAPDVDLLVIDDNSPDGTGQWCDERARHDSRVSCLHRPAKLGLGTATLAGFRYALERNYRWVVTMDADFSHDPRYLPALRQAVERAEEPCDVAIGSRYVAGGGIAGWPRYRRWMSRGINAYARWLLGLRVYDCSGAFRCYRCELLRQIDLSQFRAKGYAYVEEILWRLQHQRAIFREVPIVFVDRVRGTTKINLAEAFQALMLIARLAFARPGAARDEG